MLKVQKESHTGKLATLKLVDGSWYMVKTKVVTGSWQGLVQLFLLGLELEP